jgi:hypothetical protein
MMGKQTWLPFSPSCMVLTLFQALQSQNFTCYMAQAKWNKAISRLKRKEVPENE